MVNRAGLKEDFEGDGFGEDVRGGDFKENLEGDIVIEEVASEQQEVQQIDHFETKAENGRHDDAELEYAKEQHFDTQQEVMKAIETPRWAAELVAKIEKLDEKLDENTGQKMVKPAEDGQGYNMSWSRLAQKMLQSSRHSNAMMSRLYGMMHEMHQVTSASALASNQDGLSKQG